MGLIGGGFSDDLAERLVTALATTSTAGLATTATRLAALSQADGVGAALHSLAGHLAHAAGNIGRALQGLAEEANNVRHFY